MILAGRNPRENTEYLGSLKYQKIVESIFVDLSRFNLSEWKNKINCSFVEFSIKRV